MSTKSLEIIAQMNREKDCLEEPVDREEDRNVGCNCWEKKGECDEYNECPKRKYRWQNLKGTVYDTITTS
jgi:hypothetical protein